MGVWMIATGVLRIEPEPDDALIRDYIYFSENTNPYKEMEGEFMDSFWEVCKEKERQYKLWKDKKKALIKNERGEWY